MGGMVVQGLQGDRARYQPLKSVLTESCVPLDVARALWAETGCGDLYIADLDAIERSGEHWVEIQKLATEIPVCLWVDAGVRDPEAIATWMEAGVGRVVVGSETVHDVEDLDAIRAALPADRLVFSLDLQQGQILSACPELHTLPPLSFLGHLADGGWTHVILLTLDRVGTGSGPDLSLWEEARHRFPDLKLLAGGGVRSVEDLHRLSQLGASGVLVASALHSGRLTRTDLHPITTGLGV
jgi:phosphoribosylformimino-5-aminoimidazole carboxamide ribotide isomerase